MRSRRGFTLIEILVVIALIGLLVVALLPRIEGTLSKSDQAQTQMRLLLLRRLIDAYQTSPFGDYPPDDFKDPDGKLVVKADATNPGIESCLIFIHRDDHRGAGLGDYLTEWVGNTDHDRNEHQLGKLGTDAKLELLDTWGMPIAYFHHAHYGAAQEYLSADGRTVRATAWKKDGAHVNKTTYQLFSAGPDGQFGTTDDLTLFRKGE